MSVENQHFCENEQNCHEHREYYTVWELNRYAEKSAEAIFDSLDWEWNDIIHFPWQIDSKFLLKWLNDNLKQLCENWELSMEYGLTVYFDDDPWYRGFTICKLNEGYYKPWELESKYWEKWNFWDASHFDWRSEWKLKIDDTRYAIYAK